MVASFEGAALVVAVVVVVVEVVVVMVVGVVVAGGEFRPTSTNAARQVISLFPLVP